MKITEKALAVLRETQRLGRIDAQQTATILCPNGRKNCGLPFRGQGAGFLGGGYLAKLRKLGLLDITGSADEVRSFFRLSSKAKQLLKDNQP